MLKLFTCNYTLSPLAVWYVMVCHSYLRKNNGWVLKQLLEYEPFKYRAPGKQECYLILESLSAKSKAGT